MTRHSAPAAVAAVYLAALVQGATMISFAACSAVLKERLDFTDAQYGAIFIPQVLLSVSGSVASGLLARRLGLDRLLVLGLGASALSQVALATAEPAGPGAAFPVVALGTALMGLGAGVNAAPLNTYPQVLFPGRAEAAVVAVHALLGMGLALAPLALAAALSAGSWTLFPLGLAVVCFTVASAPWIVRLPQAPPQSDARGAGAGPRPARSAVFWLFLAIAVLYALAEASFSNWAVLFLHEEKGLSATAAATALSTFWITLTAGRVLVSIVILRVPALAVWLALPVLMGAAFLLLPGADTVGLAHALFALAGLGCSGFFPLTVGLASKRFPAHVAFVSSAVFAGLGFGIGTASFLLGALRAWLPLTQLYRLCTAYPATALALALVVMRGARRP